MTNENNFQQTLFEGLGEASTCWSERPSGTFESTRAKEIGDRILTEHEHIRQADREESVAMLLKQAITIESLEADNAKLRAALEEARAVIQERTEMCIALQGTSEKGIEKK